MEGVLGKIGKFVQNPTVQGVLGAALVGANPLVGVLAGPALKNKRERSELENQRLRLEIANAKKAGEDIDNQRELISRIPGLLDNSPLELGVDSNDAVLPLPTTVNQDLQERFQGKQQNELTGVLGQLAPDVLAQNVLSPREPRRLPSDLQTMQALNIPLTEEGFESFQNLKAGDESIDDILKRLQVNKLLDEQDANRADRDNAKIAGDTAVVDTLDTIERLAGANERLSDSTLVAPGSTFLDERRGIASFIADVGETFNLGDFGLRQDVEDIDTFRKESAILAGNALKSMEAQGITVTRALQGLVESANASDQVSTGTNNSILKISLKETLREADRRNLELENRSRYETLLKQLEGQKFEFGSEAEAANAFNAGAFSIGDTVVINGKEVVVQDDG